MGVSYEYSQPRERTTPVTREIRRRAGRAVRGTASVLVVLAFLGGLFGKAEMSGWHDFFRFFTNWSWTIQTVFYTALTIGIISDALWDAAVILLFLPILNLAFFVWIMLQIIVATDPKLLESLHSLPDRVVEIGNEYYHSLPVVLILVVAATNGMAIRRALKRILKYHDSVSPWMKGAYFLWCTYFPLLLGGLYRITNDPMDVYGINSISIGSLLAIGLAVNTGTGVVSFMFYSPFVSHKQ